jgi:oxygen-independent coproporphyrinogen-3 oxidase
MTGENSSNTRELGLYIHIPFCLKKCDYCDFLSAPATDEGKAEYIEALLKEIESYRGRTSGYIASTIFFGGGTPSCIDAEDIARVVEGLRKVFLIDENKLEATIEVNPGTVTRDKLIVYQRVGINRLSFGLQSTDNRELECLGRIHTFEEFKENYRLARELGFTNINIDLMSALPGQTLASWERTLNTVLMLKPEHISAYSLIIEEGTDFYRRYGPGTQGAYELPDEETDRSMYYKTKSLLEQYGYHRYEISNYAKPGYESRHNNFYWIGTDYLGLGLGAASLLQGVRFSNTSDRNEYLTLCSRYEKGKYPEEGNRNTEELSFNQSCREEEAFVTDIPGEDMDQNEPGMLGDEIGIRREVVKLTKEQRMEEFMFLGLRRCEGISQQEFMHRFSVDLTKVYGKVFTELMRKGLLEVSGDNIRLTEYGIDISNRVLSEFLIK